MRNAILSIFYIKYCKSLFEIHMEYAIHESCGFILLNINECTYEKIMNPMSIIKLKNSFEKNLEKLPKLKRAFSTSFMKNNKSYSNLRKRPIKEEILIKKEGILQNLIKGINDKPNRKISSSVNYFNILADLTINLSKNDENILPEKNTPMPKNHIRSKSLHRTMKRIILNNTQRYSRSPIRIHKNIIIHGQQFHNSPNLIFKSQVNITNL